MNENYNLHQMTSTVVNQKKKNIIPLIVILVAALLIIVAVVIMLLINTKEKPQVEEKEILETQSVIVATAIEKITLSQNCTSHPHVYLQDRKITAKDISNEDMYNIVLQQLPAFKEYKDFTSDEIRTEIVKLAGADYEYEDKTYPSSIIWTYDSENKKYVISSEQLNCKKDVYTDIAKVTKAYKEDDEVIIYVRAIFTNPETKKYYKDRALTQELTDLDTNDSVLMTNDMSSVIEKSKIFKETSSNYQKAALYKVIFEVKDNSYKFISSEPISE